MTHAYFLIIVAGIFSTFGNLLLKRSRQNILENASLLNEYLSLNFVGAIICYGINLVIFAKALDNLPVNIAYPILAVFGFSALSISSWYVFGERLSWIQIVGLVVVTIGITLLSWQTSD